MKTTPHITTINKRHESDPRARRNGRNFPQTDQDYLGTTLTGGCGAPAKFRRPSFRDISNGYFSHEAPRDFAFEAAFFSAIILLTALPILNSAHALAALVRSTGLL
jgi:hypothetical protein